MDFIFDKSMIHYNVLFFSYPFKKHGNFFLDKMSLDLDLNQFHDNNIGIDDIDMNTNNGQNQAEKRAHHNALERKRRDHIKGSFNDLRDVIPLLKGEKVKIENFHFN